MKIPMIAAAATAALALAVPASAQDRAERAEAAFAELVDGRVAGEPQSCINTFNSNRLRVVERVGLAYRDGDTLWVARASNPEDLGAWDVPIIERHGSRLCRHDVMRTIDRGSGFFTGNLFLGDFVPYTEVAEG
ncbi:MAG: hypothetical protein JY451_05035 [Erythrobacter sp.]|nr:MAG: hypothetical protein JY451_05035 [Erythrobacter sp.]